MVEKYLWTPHASQLLCDFLEPMLVVNHRKRAQARDIVDHVWLETELTDEDLAAF